MSDHTFQMTMLFDFFGNLLTERQQEFFNLYYNEDFSLAEIAEHAGITRQGVRDVLIRAEAIMVDIEEKTGLMERFQDIRKTGAAIDAAAEEILQLNDQSLYNSDLQRLALSIRDDVSSLKE